MMTSTSVVSRDPPVSMSRDDDQAKAGSNTTLPVECDTDPGTSPSRKELVKLHLDRDSFIDQLRIALRLIVTCLKPELKRREKVRGLWQDPPEGWPEDEPFRDPNNNSKHGKKPQKDELFAMYKTAVRLYIQTYHEGIPTMDGMPLTVDVSQPQRSVTGSSTCEHLETASGVDAFNKRQHQGTQPEESHMSTLCQPTLWELRIKPLGLGSPDASRNINDRRDSDTEVNGNQGVMIAGGTYPMVVKDVPRPQLQFGMDPFTSSVSETRMDEALDKYGQACDGVSPTLVSFQSQPPEAGHWDSAQSKTAAGGSDVTSLRQGKQPEASSMSACSELRKKRLGTGLPADCSANDRQHSNAEVNENQVKEGPVPGPGPQLQGAESEVTEDQVLEELERYDDRESTPANFISHVVRYFTTELKPVVGVGARMPNHDTGQAGHAPVQYQCSDTSNQCEHPTVSTELRTDIRPNGTLTDSASNADECPEQENGPKTPGNQMQRIFCEEPPDHHTQNKSRKRKLTSVVESEPGPPLPKRLCPGTNGKFTESLHVPPRPRATQTGPPTTASEMICSLCENVCSKCHCAYKL